MVVFWVFFGLFIAWMVKMASHHNHSEEDAGYRPLDVLNERYAKGELSKKEYEDMKKDIMKKD